jgi:hypothetical protein
MTVSVTNLTEDSENIGRVILATGNDRCQRDSLSKIGIVFANYGEFCNALSKRKQCGGNSGVRVCAYGRVKDEVQTYHLCQTERTTFNASVYRNEYCHGNGLISAASLMTGSD